MDSQPLMVLLIGLGGGLIVGGLLVAWWVSERNAAPEDAVDAVAEPPTQYAVDYIRAWKVTANGRLQLTMGEQSLSAPESLTPEQKKAVIALVMDLRPWIDSRKKAAPAPQPTPLPPQPQPVSQSPTPAVQPIAPIQYTPSPPIPAEQANTEAAPRSIAMQIDEILQEMLLHSPLKERGIRLSEMPGHGVVVWVGAQQFDGVGAVTDPEVQSIIKAAVSEWEKRATPGE